MQTPLEVQILKTAKLRTTILMVFFAFFGIMWTLFVSTSPAHYHKMLGPDVPLYILPISLLSVAAYFLGLRIILTHFINHDMKLPTFVRYFNAFVEVSIPSIVIIVMSQYIPPEYILFMPPVIVYFIFIILSSLSLNIWLCIFSGMIAALQFLGISYYVLNFTDVSGLSPILKEWYGFQIRGAILFASGIVAGFVTIQIKSLLMRSFEIEQERERILRVFGRHVSPEVANKILSGSSKSSEFKPICVMFLDIRNFTHYSELHKPDVVVNYLNHLFEYMIDIIHDNNGIINKFLGDGFMAAFGAPISSGNDVMNAVNAGFAIIKRTELEVKAGNIPETHVGIGIHFGPVLTGTLGTKRRQEYTIIGDVVNSASHIEQLNKLYHSTMLISQDARARLPKAQGKLIGNADIKHRDKPIKIYQLA